MQSNDSLSHSVLYCQQNRTQELNNRIFSRNNPYFHQPPRFTHNPVNTKRIKFPVISSNNVCNNTSKKNGFIVYPVNPNYAGKTIEGDFCYDN